MVCEVLEKGCKLKPEELFPDPEIIARHCLQHRYGLQIVKCLDETCCPPFETNWMEVFPNQFLPPPAVYQFGAKGLEIVEPSEYFANTRKYNFATLSQRLISKLSPEEAFKGKNGQKCPVPFDTYCESMQKDIPDCVCSKCGLYWPSVAAKKRHSKAHKRAEKAVQQNEMTLALSDSDTDMDEDLELEEEAIEELPDSGPMPVIEDIRSHLTYSPFEPIPNMRTTRSQTKQK